MHTLQLEIIVLSIILLFVQCKNDNIEENVLHDTLHTTPYIQVLGIAQDAGFPQAGCTKECCIDLWVDRSNRKMVSCLALVDPVNSMYWLFDATPDFNDQIALVNAGKPQAKINLPNGIFLTHGHIGHYTGLMFLGREAVGASELPVYVLPRMNVFLSNNGPWDQLVRLENIKLIELEEDQYTSIGNDIYIKAIEVPHRDEYTETAGFYIKTKEKTALFIPDIDKWEKWKLNIVDEIQSVDIAFLDGSFFQNGELPNRDMSEIPHPFIEESMLLFKDLSKKEKAKIHFIHFNHTNPVLYLNSEAYNTVIDAGFQIAAEAQKYPM